ncbi:MAG: prepilin-type N-terminal cleavage/methylation domain-containing protein [bacterium]
MTRRQGRKGFTLIEVLVAMLLFAIGAAALAQTLAVAQHVRAGSGRWLRAVELAEQRLELLRAGDRGDDAVPLGPFTRSWRSVPFGVAGVEQLEVSVTWEDHGPQRLLLTALRRRP